MVRKLIPALAAGLLTLASCGEKAIPLDRVAGAIPKAAPGDTLVVKDGEYSDVELRWRGSAPGESPVVVMPQTPGGVRITGRSSLHISGTGLEINSFLFDGCVADKGAIVEFRDGDSLARDCRMTSCVMDSCNPARRDISYSYVHLYGRGNRVDHNSFMGKLNLGVTLIVMLNYDGCDENHHLIDHNVFGPRPVYGSNGAETIRVGTSQQCMQNSRTVIEDNLFDRCNGEVEVISIKSCENIIRRNVLYECQGVLALRHGDRNVAEDNLFIGHGVRNTGGVRIVGEDQVVRGNTFLSLAGERFFSALALMCGVPNSLPNRYMQVKRTVVENNVFEACRSIEFNTGADFERTLPPVETVWKDNVVSPVQSSEEPSREDILDGRGASWYTASEAVEPGSGKEVRLASGDDVAKAVAGASDGDVFILSDSLYVLENGIEVAADIEIKAAPGASPLLKYAGRKPACMITICDGGRLKVSGLSFTGVLTPGRSLAKGIISTAVDMIEPYSLFVEDCSFSNCGESGFIPVRGLKGTFADTVAIRRCNFSALSGDAVNYAAETADKGVYSGDDVIIEDCRFERILGIPVNIYRGGSDESTAGPYVTIKGCVFDDCCNKVRGSVIRITGAQVLSVTGCDFIGSGRGGYSVRLDEAPWEKIELRDLRFVNSGKVLSNRKLL